MTPTPPSTTSSSNGARSPLDAQHRIVRKRNRVPLSCGPCRHRKLKCNRALPCENCVKRGDSSSCSYVSSGSRKQTLSHASAGSPDEMQHRIDRLEGLVFSLMTNGSQAAGPTAAAAAVSTVTKVEPNISLANNNVDYMEEDKDGEESETEQVARSLGVMKVNNNQTAYYSDSHWATILHEVAEIKEYYAGHKKQVEEGLARVHAFKQSQQGTRRSAFLFGVSATMTQEQLIAAMPLKHMSDKLISRFFTVYDPTLHILHPPTFMKQYEQYWRTPYQTSVTWLGLLYAVLSLAASTYNRPEDEPLEYQGKTLEYSAEYKKLAAECLLLNDYTKPNRFTIEALIYYLGSEYVKNNEADINVWLLNAIIIRLAMRMGYHRDPAPFKNITPFEGEIRRRVWTFLRFFDVLYSYQMGLPSMIRTGDCDTEMPRNVYDDEMSEVMKELPPARPSSEATPISYMITKSRLSLIFAKIIKESQSLSCSYEDVMKLDTELREAYSLTPPHLVSRPMEEQLLDSPSLIMQRFKLKQVYNKALCVLHRNYLCKARSNHRYAHSRRTCIEASMELLRDQKVIHTETGPTGGLRSLRWFSTALVSHDYLLAAMIVSLDLYHSLRGGTNDLYSWNMVKREDMIEAVKESRNIWATMKDVSMDAWKATTFLTVMLQSIDERSHDQRDVKVQVFPSSSSSGGVGSGRPQPPFATQDEQPERTAAMTLGMLSSGRVTPNTTLVFDRLGVQTPGGNVQMTDGLGNDPAVFPMDMSGLYNLQSPLSIFSSMGMNQDMQPNRDVDWGAWDSYIQSNDFQNQWLQNNPSIDFGPGGLSPSAFATVQLPDSSLGTVIENINNQFPQPSASMSLPNPSQRNSNSYMGGRPGQAGG